MPIFIEELSVLVSHEEQDEDEYRNRGAAPRVLNLGSKCHNIRAYLSAVKVNVVISGFITNIMARIALDILKIRVQYDSKLDTVPKNSVF
jgi:hypothetical protein